jgi:hypothetical protein
MDPSTLEMILLSQLDKDLWNEVSIQKIMIKDSEERSLRRMQQAYEASDDEYGDVLRAKESISYYYYDNMRVFCFEFFF